MPILKEKIKRVKKVSSKVKEVKNENDKLKSVKEIPFYNGGLNFSFPIDLINYEKEGTRVKEKRGLSLAIIYDLIKDVNKGEKKEIEINKDFFLRFNKEGFFTDSVNNYPNKNGYYLATSLPAKITADANKLLEKEKNSKRINFYKSETKDFSLKGKTTSGVVKAILEVNK